METIEATQEVIKTITAEIDLLDLYIERMASLGQVSVGHINYVDGHTKSFLVPAEVVPFVNTILNNYYQARREFLIKKATELMKS